MALLPGSDAQVDTLMLGGEALTEQAIDALSGHVNAIFDEYAISRKPLSVRCWHKRTLAFIKA